MAKHVSKITAFIKPSSPTDIVRQELAKNKESWMTNNLNILCAHYLNIIFHIITHDMRM